jgi:hypothetical protein
MSSVSTKKRKRNPQPTKEKVAETAIVPLSHTAVVVGDQKFQGWRMLFF